jgi:hypothetical protein
MQVQQSYCPAMNMAVLWVVVLCGLVEVKRHFMLAASIVRVITLLLEVTVSLKWL